jgi:hypothetical protein
MNVLYAISLVLSLLLLLGWVAAVAIAGMVDGAENFDPESRFGARGRLTLAAGLGFGLAGLSASYAGWPGVAALISALAGAAIVSGVAIRYGPGPTA